MRIRNVDDLTMNLSCTREAVVSRTGGRLDLLLGEFVAIPVPVVVKVSVELRGHFADSGSEALVAAHNSNCVCDLLAKSIIDAQLSSILARVLQISFKEGDSEEVVYAVAFPGSHSRGKLEVITEKDDLITVELEDCCHVVLNCNSDFVQEQEVELQLHVAQGGTVIASADEDESLVLLVKEDAGKELQIVTEFLKLGIFQDGLLFTGHLDIVPSLEKVLGSLVLALCDQLLSKAINMAPNLELLKLLVLWLVDQHWLIV